MERILRILQLLNLNKNFSQRDISQKLNISLGKVNGILKSLLNDEYIVTVKRGRRFNYNVTEKGIRLLEENLKEYDEIKIKLNENTSAKVNQAVILGAGERKEFGFPAGFLKIQDTRVIDRILNILKDNGIEDVIIVAGYEYEMYEELAKEKGLKIVRNRKYKWTGTMESLALAKEYINGDFILIENDLVFEERAIKEVIANDNRDCILITNESGSGDEAFVETRNGFLYKISKDKHTFNRINGEVIGITRLSQDAFNKMINEYERYNENPYLNYEYCLLDIGRHYDIGYTKIDDLVWGEIDNKDHYNKMVNYIFPRIKRKELEVRTLKLREYIVEALNIDERHIGDIIPAGGMTNKNYKVSIKDKTYILRVPGSGTEEMINRKDEKRNSEVGCSLNLDTKLLYFSENTGIKISEFIKDAETLTGTSAKKEKNMRMTTELLKTLHNSNLKLNNSFDIIGKIELYENLLINAKGKNFNDYDEIRGQVIGLKDILNDLQVEEVACHNDTVPENFVKSGEGRMYLIDWEYSGMNDPMWDLAAHSIECNFSEDDEELFLNIYFGFSPDKNIRKRILIHKIFQDFLWSIWTNLKEAKGDDFGTYGMDRYNRAKENLKILEGMK